MLESLLVTQKKMRQCLLGRGSGLRIIGQRSALLRHENVIVHTKDHFYFLGQGLWGKHIRYQFEYLLRAELSIFQFEISVAHLSQIDQVLNERVYKAELTHHDVVVMLGLGQALAGRPAGDQDTHYLLQEVDHAQKGRPHLVTDHRRKALCLLLLQILLLSLPV